MPRIEAGLFANIPFLYMILKSSRPAQSVSAYQLSPYCLWVIYEALKLCSRAKIFLVSVKLLPSDLYSFSKGSRIAAQLSWLPLALSFVTEGFGLVSVAGFSEGVGTCCMAGILSIF